MTISLAVFSASIAELVAAGAPCVIAIRTGPNRQVSGLLCDGETIATTDQALPMLDHYTVVLPGGELAAARPGLRDPAANLAVLRLDAPVPAAPPAYGSAVLGGVVVVLAADAVASPTVRLTVVHRLLRAEDGVVPVLDLRPEQIDQGALVLDPEGCVIGLTDIGPDNAAMVVPSWVVRRAVSTAPALAPRPIGLVGAAAPTVPAPATAGPTALASVAHGPAALPSATGRGWLGVALQPITVPDGLATRTGQRSGRMVVRVNAGGPAQRGGLQVGDVLLSLNGTSASGPHALRAFLGADRIGSTVEVTLLRQGTLLTANLVVERQPRDQST